MADINVNQDEIRTTREVVRELGAILGQLEDGAVEKIVVMSGRIMKGVIVSVDEYARLTEDAEPHKPRIGNRAERRAGGKL